MPLHRLATRHALVALVTVSAGACRDVLPVEPAGTGPQAPPRMEASAVGCADLTVHTDDRAHVTIEQGSGNGCGGVRPVVAGQPVFDAQGLVLSIPVAIHDGEADPMQDPARVWSADDLLKVTAVSGLIAGTETPLAFLNADSTAPDLASGSPRVVSAWRYDARLPRRNGRAFLQPDSNSAAGVIQIAVHPAVKSFQVGLRAFATLPPVSVPADPPLSVPDSVYASANVESASELMTGTFLRNVAVVMFAENATQAQKETAVRLVQGEVVGGLRYAEGDGKYYVRIPTDATAAPLLAALDRLEALPQVEAVGPEFIFGTDELLAYLRPHDGTGWTQWELSPERAAGPQWALEAIAAPLAWGCSTGSTGVHVAVVDHGFHPAVPDIAQNRVFQFQPYNWPDSVSHATSVASVIGARGNNGQGITGAMWFAGLELWSVGLDASGQPTLGPDGRYAIRNGVDVLARAIRGGAPVVNVSLGLGWSRSPAPTHADSNRVERFYRNLRGTIRRALFRRSVGGAGRPLLVFAAGNSNADAYWAGYPNLVRDFPDFVMVVGSANPTAPGAGDFGGTMTRRGTSNWGELIDLYAPGGGVGALNGAGQPITISGTSFAAPLVSGVAGLLFAFDPRLTAEQVKELLLDGAAAGHRSIVNGPFIGGPRDVLNAYESLKAAARRTGAPVCGNRVWARDGQLYVERANGAEEPIGPSEPTYAPLDVEPLHGGQYVQYRTVEGYRTLHWSNGQWALSNPPANAALRGGTRASLDGFSHDRDTLVWVNTSVVSGTDWWRRSQSTDVELFRTTVAGDAHFSTITVQNLAQPDQQICVERTAQAPQTCTMNYQMSRWWMFRIAYPQNDQPALVAVSPMYTVLLDSTGWTPCPDDAGFECREAQTEQKQGGARVYTVAWEGGSPAELTQLQDQASIFWMGQSEGDSTLVLGRGSWHITRWFSPSRWRSTGEGEYNAAGEIVDCGSEYRRLAGFAQFRRIASPNACNWDYWDQPTNAGSGTIAASRAPVRGSLSRGVTVSASAAVIRSGRVGRR